jgi:hypothetical protein
MLVAITEEAAMSGTAARPVTGRSSLSLRDAAAEFVRWASPRMLVAVVASVAIARVAVGGWSTRDLLIPAVMLAVYPLAEWCIHVLLLHMRPKRVGGRLLDPLFARKHREHHADPTQLDLVFIPLPVLWQVLAGAAVIAALAFPDLGAGLTFLLALSTIGLVYEWTHYLVHTTYRPRRALYRALWRHHRLHHHKNEHYWFGVVSTAADHALRTAPDAAAVPHSPTARDLLGTTAGADLAEGS